METTENNWILGELVNLPHQEKLLKKSGSTSYSRFIGSRYICIREATGGQRGILMKVLGKTDGDRIIMVNGQPFCKDDREELFAGKRYFSYPFPRDNEVMEALDILRQSGFAAEIRGGFDARQSRFHILGERHRAQHAPAPEAAIPRRARRPALSRPRRRRALPRHVRLFLQGQPELVKNRQYF